MRKGDDWTDEELQECLVAYLRMYQDDVIGRKFVKVQVYRELSTKTGRSVKSIERRFCNISHIINLRGRKWVTGLLPLSNVGANVQPRLEVLLDELEGYS